MVKSHSWSFGAQGTAHSEVMASLVHDQPHDAWVLFKPLRGVPLTSKVCRERVEVGGRRLGPKVLWRTKVKQVYT